MKGYISEPEYPARLGSKMAGATDDEQGINKATPGSAGIMFTTEGQWRSRLM